MYVFNIIAYLLCIVLFGTLLINSSLSLYTIFLGVAFGVVTALSNLYMMLAYANGPMNITMLVTTSSMIIPTLSGVFFGETLSFMKLMMVAMLIVFIYVSLNKGNGALVNKKWILYCFFAFIFSGAIGVLQKVHLINGSSIIICSIISIIVFKEHPTKKQVVGLVGGIFSLIAICFI